MKLFKRKEKFYPEPPPPPYPYEELVDNCPVCGAPFKSKERVNPFLGREDGRMVYTCTSCETSEGRQIIQKGYWHSGNGFLAMDYKVPPVYGDKVISFRKAGAALSPQPRPRKGKSHDAK